MKRASDAQAKRLAHLWAGSGSVWSGGVVKVGGYNPPTELALLNRGWIEPNGKYGIHPNGDAYAEHVISRAGIAALRDFLTKEFPDG